MNDSMLEEAFRMHRSGDLASASRLCDEILSGDPNHLDALYLLAAAQFQSGSFPDALVTYDKLLALKPDFAEGETARGATLSVLGRHEEALAAYDKAVALKPSHAVAWSNRGTALLELGRFPEAIVSYDRAVALKPDYAEAWRHRGLALSQAARPFEALDSFSKALTLKPNYPQAEEDNGDVLMDLRRMAEAIGCYDRAIAFAPQLARLHYKRANALSTLNYHEEAIVSCERALNLDPEWPYARGMMLHSKLQICDWRSLDTEIPNVAAGLAAGKRVISPWNHKALSDSPAEQLQCARVWVANELSERFMPLWRPKAPRDRIPIAYVSADFNNSAAAQLLAGVFEQQDRTRFETVAISFGAVAPSPMRARLENAFERFIDVGEKSDAEIAQIITDLGIGIAVDLMGFTGACRSAILAHRPAPVQVNFLGFPGSMGADWIDYILADPVLIPERAQEFYREKVVYLPDTYQPNDSIRRIAERTPARAEAGLPENAFVFCSFNNNYKIMSPVFDRWMNLLRAVKGSVLWLLHDNDASARNLRREAEARGVDASRLIFAPRAPTAEHLARHRLADLFLDTLPICAHTTASDALWAGLPIVTCMGEAFAGRVAASLLHAVDMPETITHSLDDYEALALNLARDPDALAALKSKLASNRGTAPLFDTARYTRHLESAFTEMWERYLRGAAPGGFAVQRLQ